MVSIYCWGVHLLCAISVDYLSFSPDPLFPFSTLSFRFILSGNCSSTAKMWPGSCRHSFHWVPCWLWLLPTHTQPLPCLSIGVSALQVLIYKHIYVFSTTSWRPRQALLHDDIFRGTAPVAVVGRRVGATWKNTTFFSGELPCQKAVNVAEGCSPGPVKGSIKGMIWNVKKNQ